MHHQYQLHYTPKILRSAAVTFFRQLIGLRFPFLLVGLTVYFVWQFSIGNRSWLFGATAGAVFVVVVIMLSLFIGHLRHATKTAVELESSPSTLVIADAGVCFRSSLGTTEIPWAKVAALHHCKDFLLLTFKSGSYTSIPIHSLDEAGINLIKSSIAKVGGKVN